MPLRGQSQVNQLWELNSHWRDALADEAWLEAGEDHLAIFHVFARALERAGSLGTVVEWGCGGGANAVAFAPRAEKFIGADDSPVSLLECERQVRAVCDTPVETRRIDPTHPERAAAGLEQACSTFLCLGVGKLTTGRDELERILRIAEQVLFTGGIALFRVSHHTGDGHTPGLTFTIEEFWELAKSCGLEPKLITCVPQNRLDVRYAYYALEKP